MTTSDGVWAARGRITPEERDRTVRSLKRLPTFRKLGRRLLADVAERSLLADWSVETHRLLVEDRPAEGLQHAVVVDGPFYALVILEGRLTGMSQTDRVAALEAEERGDGPPPSFHVELSGGAYARTDAGLSSILLGDLLLAQSGVRPDRPDRARFLVVTQDALAGSPALGWSLPRDMELPPWTGMDAGGRKAALLPSPDDLRTVELVWVSREPALAHAHDLEPLVHVLAGAIAKSRDELDGATDRHTAIVDIGDDTTIRVWRKGRFEIDLEIPNDQLDEHRLRSAVDPTLSIPRVFVVHTKDPMRRPDSLEAVLFDRVVHLAEEIPAVLPAPLRPILRQEVFGRWDRKELEPYFAAFVPTIPVPKRNPPGGARPSAFRARPIAPSFEVEPDQKKIRSVRPNRDACTLPLDRVGLRRAWRQWKASGKGQENFVDSAVSRGAIEEEAAYRWARAHTLQRVGVAFSGGGACAYRALPVLERLTAKRIPVDVFAGLSGGALAGAYYCLQGREGIVRLARAGWFIQLTLGVTSLTTAPLELITDYLLSGARIENLGVRLVAAAVALPRKGPPVGTVAVRGSLGEAVRASGTLPAMFAPTEFGATRYTDGAGCTIVPTRVAVDYGADVVLACNVMPASSKTNPWEDLPGGNLLRQLPILERWIDFSAWRGAMTRDVSRRYGEDGDVFIEFEPYPRASIEPLLFARAWEIIAKANEEGEMLDERIDRFRGLWRLLPGRPDEGSP